MPRKTKTPSKNKQATVNLKEAKTLSKENRKSFFLKETKDTYRDYCIIKLMPWINLMILFMLLLSINGASAIPPFLKEYTKNPRHKAELVSCSLCHKSASGGDERNSFGEYFETHGHYFSEDLIKAFPDKFKSTDPKTP